jgi:hypothetical protein
MNTQYPYFCLHMEVMGGEWNPRWLLMYLWSHW